MNYKKIFLLLCLYTTFGDLKAMDTPELTHEDYKNLLNDREKNDKDLNAPLDEAKYPLLHDLIEKKYNDLVALVLEKQLNIDLNEKTGPYKSTYLHTAARRDNPQAIKILLGKGAKVGLKDDDGNTPLLKASAWGYFKCMKSLITGGANINEQNPRNSTSLRNCIVLAPNSIPCVQLLLRSHADPNLIGISGTSALIKTVENCIGNKKKPSELKTLAQLLITFGADITIRAEGKSPDGKATSKTASDLARGTNQNKLADFIELYAQQRDDIFASVGPETMFEQLPITSDKNEITIPRLYIKNANGNNLVRYALDHWNIKLFNKCLCLRPEMLNEPNFAGQAAVDLILADDSKRMRFIQLINWDELIKNNAEQQLQ